MGRAAENSFVRDGEKQEHRHFCLLFEEATNEADREQELWSTTQMCKAGCQHSICSLEPWKYLRGTDEKQNVFQ